MQFTVNVTCNIIILIGIFHVRLFVYGQVWCDNKFSCKINDKIVANTMCLYQPWKDRLNCVGIEDIQTETDRNLMVSLHNTYRNKLANGKVFRWPEAANMRQLSYDATLEMMALRWAQQCYDRPDECRRTEEFDFVEQNMYTGFQDYGLPSYNKSFWEWVHDQFPFAKTSIVNSFVNRRVFAHFATSVWAETYKIGCANVEYRDHGHMIRKVVCNYAPGRNATSKKMYEKGDPCTRCPAGTQCKPLSTFPQLCALPSDPTDLPPVDMGASTLTPLLLPIMLIALLPLFLMTP